MKLHVLTACTRPHQLDKLARSITAATCEPWEVRWHVGLDPNRQHIGGQQIKNQLLEEVTDGWVYMLDDDTVMHPDLLRRVAEHLDADAVVVSQERADRRHLQAVRENLRVGWVDIGQAVIRRDVIDHHRIPNSYEGDGEFLAAVLADAQVAFVDEVLSYHNRLDSDWPTIAISTPWQNHPELLRDYMEAVEAGRPDELWIVDNGSDPPLDFAQIRLEENRGFCGGCNAGLAAATTDAVLFLNNDIGMRSADWLDRIRAALEPGVLVGAVLRNDQHAWVDGTPLEYLDGWCLAGMRDDLLELGGFDETLVEPAYYSDNLLCLEARAAGMTLREVKVGLWHQSGATSTPATNPHVKKATELNRERYQERARELLGAPA